MRQTATRENSQRQSPVRDHRIDFLRGLALVMIFVNHIPGNMLGNLTNRNLGFSDSAEIFVLLAGFAAAMAYYHRFAGGQPLATTVRLYRRAGLLYTAHIVTSVLALALFSAAAIALARPELTSQINIEPFMRDPVSGLVGFASLTYQPGYFNILPLYIVLLCLLPAYMLLYRAGWQWLLGTALAIYAAASLNHWTLPSFPAPNTWFFNPLSWQLLFVIGFIWGAQVRSGVQVPSNRYVYWSAVIYVVAAFIWVRWGLWGMFPKTTALGELWGFSKTYLSPFRLLHILALAYIIAYSPLGQWMKSITPRNPLVQMGQHALPVFCVGSLLSMSFLIARDHLGGSLWLDAASVAAGVLIMMALAEFLAWQASSPAGQVGSVAAGGFVAAVPPVPPPSYVSQREPAELVQP